jgi:hypothetical protein
MPNTLLIYPMVAHVAWTAVLYALLTVARAPSIWGLGRRRDGSNPWSAVERRLSANLSNQFEWPLFFYAGCLLMIELRAVDAVQVGLAWAFVTGRVVHSFVQVLTTNIRLRGIVFTINFLAVIGMWLWLLVVLYGAKR